MHRLARFFRPSPVVTLTRDTLAVIQDLEESGCQVLSAAVLPRPMVRVDKQPQDLDTYGRQQPVYGAIPYPLEHVAVMRGVRVTWFAVPVRMGVTA